MTLEADGPSMLGASVAITRQGTATRARHRQHVNVTAQPPDDGGAYDDTSQGPPGGGYDGGAYASQGPYDVQDPYAYGYGGYGYGYAVSGVGQPVPVPVPDPRGERLAPVARAEANAQANADAQGKKDKGPFSLTGLVLVGGLLYIATKAKRR